MYLNYLPDEVRRRLAVTVGLLLVVLGAATAALMVAVGRDAVAGAALGVALAASLPALVGMLALRRPGVLGG